MTHEGAVCAVGQAGPSIDTEMLVGMLLTNLSRITFGMWYAYEVEGCGASKLMSYVFVQCGEAAGGCELV